MKFEHYIKKLSDSEIYKSFKKENPRAYLCAGFFIIDFETGKNIYQLDYMLKNRKIATFSLEEGVKVHVSNAPFRKKLPEIKGDITTDLKALKGIVEDEMKNRTITDNIKKIIAVLQVVDGRIVWNLNCITNNLNILQIHIDDANGTILKFMKYSILDFVKTVPGAAAMPKDIKISSKQMPQETPEQQPEVEE